MTEKKSFLLAAGVLGLVVLVIGALWLGSRSGETSLAGVPDREVPAALQGDRDAVVGGTEREAIPVESTDPISMRVYMSPLCGCCGGWVDHVKEYGFEPEVLHRDNMGPVKEAFRIPWQLSSCHTAVVNGYVIEGHVPGEDVRRFLAEAPDAHGLTVPGMPIGSPGMESPDGRVEAYEVLLIGPAGQTEVYARHGPVDPR